VPQARCARCRRLRPLVERARAAGAYEGALRSVIHALKYEGRRSLAGPLATLMRARCQAVLDGAHVLVPVPLHSSRRRARGFNQAMDLARRLSGGTLPVRTAIRRVRATPSQTGLPAAQRRRNMREAFAPARRLRWRRRTAPPLRGLIVVLVDDVSTTGATLDACAMVLLAMGASEVRAVTAARAVMPPR
jgi:ComF family protein